MKAPWLTVCVVAVIAFLRLTEARPNEPGKAAPPAVHTMRGQKAGQVRDDNGLKMKLVWCPPGFFAMEYAEFRPETASDVTTKDDEAGDERPEKPRTTLQNIRVKVFVTGCWMGKFEVMRSEWKQVMDSEPWNRQDNLQEKRDFPATHISWDDAQTFCQRLTRQERDAGRLPDDWEYSLPTEAQWERACRARTETAFCFGDDESKVGEYAWFVGNTREAGEEYAHRVGQKEPNAWGLHDMHGNVWEWCRDAYVQAVPGGRNPEVTTGGSRRVYRGGSWNDSPSGCRSSHRIGDSANHRYVNLGFRVVLNAVVQSKPADAGAESQSRNDK